MDVIITAAQSFSPWEALAVACAVAYLLLAVQESIWCWLFAFVSTMIYTALFWNVSLLMDSALHVYYMAMAIFGWYQWTHGRVKVIDSAAETSENGDAGANSMTSSDDSDQDSLPIRSMSAQQHLCVIAIIVALSTLSGYYLSEQTTAAWPYVDSFTTWASVITTYLVTQKYLQNWLYWVVIDLVAVPLYIDRGLTLTAILFVFYVFIAAFGYFKWKRHYSEQPANVIP